MPQTHGTSPESLVLPKKEKQFNRSLWKSKTGMLKIGIITFKLLVFLLGWFVMNVQQSIRFGIADQFLLLDFLRVYRTAFQAGISTNNDLPLRHSRHFNVLTLINYSIGYFVNWRGYIFLTKIIISLMKIWCWFCLTFCSNSVPTRHDASEVCKNKKGVEFWTNNSSNLAKEMRADIVLLSL